MSKIRIVIVDDELSIIKLLKANLEANGFTVVAAMDGAEALKTIELEPPGLVILDIKMPKMDGFEVCRRLREWTQVPIIMLSANTEETDKIKCLDLGADDYIIKPFSTNELAARVNAVLRRTRITVTAPPQSSMVVGNIEVNFSQRRVTIKGKEVKLTPTEFLLLQELIVNKEKVLTHLHLLNKIWGPEYKDEDQYLHVFVNRLRGKIESDPTRPKYLVTKPGIGYQFVGDRAA